MCACIGDCSHALVCLYGCLCVCVCVCAVGAYVCPCVCPSKCVGCEGCCGLGYIMCFVCVCVCVRSVGVDIVSISIVTYYLLFTCRSATHIQRFIGAPSSTLSLRSTCLLAH